MTALGTTDREEEKKNLNLLYCRDPEDKLIRHRACSLRDTAYTLIKAEMDTDFEEECRKISNKRKEQKETEQKTEAEEQIDKQDGNFPFIHYSFIIFF